VTAAVTPPEGLSNRMPTLQIRWPTGRIAVTGEAVARQLFETTPRVSLFPARGSLAPGETGLSIGPYMMAPGDEKIVAERIVAALRGAVPVAAKPLATPSVDLTGSWEVRIEYAASSSTHALHLRQRGNELDGVHQGDFVSREANGTIDGDAVRIRSEYPESHGDALNFSFTGRVSGESMAGELDMGEYLKARFSARRTAGRSA
jgi:L-seryl-tRNA(Ser) seleniumtransferase